MANLNVLEDRSEQHDDPAHDSVFGNVLGVYEQHGYDSGYTSAVRDVLLGLLDVTEEFIRREKLDPRQAGDLRKVVWRFEERLRERRGENARESEFVEGGLGI